MCRVNRDPVWERECPQPVAVGEIVAREPYILLSEGQRQDGRTYALWWPQGHGLLYVIDRVSRGPDRCVYEREYECDDAACIARTFLSILNPGFHDEFRKG